MAGQHYNETKLEDSRPVMAPETPTWAFSFPPNTHEYCARCGRRTDLYYLYGGEYVSDSRTHGYGFNLLLCPRCRRVMLALLRQWRLGNLEVFLKEYHSKLQWNKQSEGDTK